MGVYACSNGTSRSNNGVSAEKQIAKIQNLEVTIKGMTCEIGCAKLIESKTHKLEGMIYSKVSFEHGLGQFTIDSDKISIAEIEKHINGIAGGELYNVTSSTIVEEFTKFKNSEEISK